MANQMNWDSYNLTGLIFTILIIAVLFVPATSRAVEIKIDFREMSENLSDIDDPIDLITIEDPTLTKESDIMAWKVTDDSGNILDDDEFDVRFESSGITLSEDDAENLDVEEDYLDYSLFFKYHLGDGDEFDEEFTPSGSKSDRSTEVNYTQGELKISYSPENDENINWYELLAGTYVDEITITVSSN